MKRLLVLLMVSLTGCATCREHPVACAATFVATAAVIGYEASHHRAHEKPLAIHGPATAPCTPQPDGSCF